MHNSVIVPIGVCLCMFALYMHVPLHMCGCALTYVCTSVYIYMYVSIQACAQHEYMPSVSTCVGL